LKTKAPTGFGGSVMNDLHGDAIAAALVGLRKTSGILKLRDDEAGVRFTAKLV